MLRTDPEVRSSWRILWSTLLSASWRFEPGAGDPALAARACAYANEAFGLAGHTSRMTETWEDALRRLLLYVPVGFRYAEQVYYVREGVVWLAELADCEPTAHMRWLTSPDGRHLDGVLQRAITGEPQPEPIPAEKLLLLSLDRTGDNYEGVGLLRPAWFWYRAKKHATDSLTVAVERFGMPIPRVSVDWGAAEDMGWDSDRLDAEIERKRTEAASLYQTERSYLVDSPAVSWQIFGDGTFDPSALNAVIDLCDRQIAAAFLTSFKHLGLKDTGARNVGEVHENIFRRSAINVLDQVAGAVSKQVIAPLVLWNFGIGDGAPETPRLVHSGLDVDALSQSLGALPGLVSAQLLSPTPGVEAAVRSRLGIPTDEVAAGRDYTERLGPLASYPSAGRPRNEEA